MPGFLDPEALAASVELD
ncbi:hypothetical protein [Chroococcidiopsis sp. CCALA 051]